MEDNSQRGSNLEVGEAEPGQNVNLQRKLKARHLSMIAIGGAIGTGLFFASGGAISQAGPGGALIAYGVMGMLVYFLMTSLGEMSTQLPLPGAFEAYANRFVDPALGFALGWNYWFSWSITLAAELVAGALIIKFWFPDTPATLWAILFLAILLSLNLVSVKAFGEAEYWFAGIKVVTVIIFLIVGVLMIVGIMGNHTIGFQNWSLKDPATGDRAPFVGGLFTMLSVFLIAGFSFQGTEMVGLAAAESENPEKHVPKAIRSVFWRILIFYLGSIIVVGCIIPFTDPSLLSSGVENIATSPFTIVFKNAGLAVAASFMNAIILTSVLSCGNSSLYCSSRMLHAMAHSGKAPKIFGKTNKRGVPIYAVLATTCIGALAFFTTMVGDGKIYQIFYNASGLTGFFIWLGIAICHFRFRRAWVAQGHSLSELKYRSKFYPFGPVAAMFLCVIVIFGANIWIFQADTFSWFDFITNYALIPVVVLLYVVYKIKHKTKLVPLKECDFTMPTHGEEGSAPVEKQA